jgi:bacillithiol biosynthesis cysteine-adding enzyme BshC
MPEPQKGYDAHPMESFAPAFLRGEPRATALLDDGFRRATARLAAVNARADQRVDPAIVETLRGSPANRNALLQPGTIAVVSGQQAGLFMGPLYTFYKCCSAIAWARFLEQETGRRCVPIFWLQTEDHDFAEIASCYVPPETLALPPNPASCSVAHVGLPPEVSSLLDRVHELVGSQPHWEEIEAILRSAYVPGRGICEAFANALSQIFADEGLLLLDPRHESIARASMPIWRRAISEADQIERILQQRGQQLEQAGFAQQVQLRTGSPLVFFHDTEHGTRRRVGSEEKQKLLEAKPLQLSSSALLRPIVQDSLLPCAVYLGGPAELSYFAQIEPLYEFFGATPSLRAPRASFRLIDAHVAKALQQLHLQPKEVEQPRALLLQKLGSKTEKLPPLLQDLAAVLHGAATKHPSLERAARRTQLSVERALQKFARQHARMVAEEDRVISDRLKKVQDALFPHGEPQERLDSLPLHAARHGLSRLKELALANVHPGESGTGDLYP